MRSRGRSCRCRGRRRGCRRARDRARARWARRARRRLRAHRDRRRRVRRAAGRYPAAVGDGGGVSPRLRVGDVLRRRRRALAVARAARLPPLRLPLSRAQRGDAASARGKRPPPERARRAVAGRLRRGGCGARPGTGAGHRRGRVVVRRGRLLRPAAERRRSVRGGPRHPHRRGRVARRRSARTRSSSRPGRTRRGSSPVCRSRGRTGTSSTARPIAERLLEPLVISAERHFAAKQLGNGRVLASDLAARGDVAQQPVWLAHMRTVIDELLPRLTYVSFPLLVRGEYDMTPDHQPILGAGRRRRLRGRRLQRARVHDRARGGADHRRRRARRTVAIRRSTCSTWGASQRIVWCRSLSSSSAASGRNSRTWFANPANQVRCCAANQVRCCAANQVRCCAAISARIRFGC